MSCYHFFFLSLLQDLILLWCSKINPIASTSDLNVTLSTLDVQRHYDSVLYFCNKIVILKKHAFQPKAAWDLCLRVFVAHEIWDSASFRFLLIWETPTGQQRNP